MADIEQQTQSEDPYGDLRSPSSDLRSPSSDPRSIHHGAYQADSRTHVSDVIAQEIAQGIDSDFELKDCDNNRKTDVVSENNVTDGDDDLLEFRVSEGLFACNII